MLLFIKGIYKLKVEEIRAKTSMNAVAEAEALIRRSDVNEALSNQRAFPRDVTRHYSSPLSQSKVRTVYIS